MALIQSTAIPSGATDYELEQSLRFDNDRSTTLSKNFSSAGNRRTWSFSVWFKRGNMGGVNNIGNKHMFMLDPTGGSMIRVADDCMQIYDWNGSADYGWISTAVVRDSNAWYHALFVVDTTSGTATHRQRIYLNGVELTDKATDYGNPPQNHDTQINTTGTHYLGGASSNQYFDGYLAEVNFIDGQALTPADFGETGDYGEWKPIEYEGTYGTNGFYLPFKQDYTVEGFSTVTYKGTGASQYIGGVGFQPDFVWFKGRSNNDEPRIMDSVRGLHKTFKPHQNVAEDNDETNGLTGYSADGVSIGNQATINTSGNTYVVWSWDMGGSNASNTNGSITSTVRANTTYGQSIVSYTGNNIAGATIGHGLSSQPDMIIVKKRAGGDAYNWGVWHTGLSNNNGTKQLWLNSDSAERSEDMFNNAIFPSNSSTVFAVGQNNHTNYPSGATYIAYCFHDVSGYSKFGSYSGTGSTGLSVTTGFNPAFVMLKRTDASDSWSMYDNMRPIDGTKILFADSSNAEDGNSTRAISFQSTGFTVVGTDSSINASGGTYIYMAFADKREYAYWLDQSGNNNDWTSNNLTESDISVDSPTNNFCTMNPLEPSANGTYSEGNLRIQTAQYPFGKGTFHVSAGKWYWEWTHHSGTYNTYTGIGNDLRVAVNESHNTANTQAWLGNDAALKKWSSTSGYDAGTLAINDIIGIAVDLDNGSIKFYINNTLVGTDTTLPAGTTVTPLLGGSNDGTDGSGWGNITFNFGQDSSFSGFKTAQGNQDGNDIGDFYYTPPTGFLALCTSNLPDVAVTPSENFNTVTYTGNGSTQNITGVGFQPDWVWFKSRSFQDNHTLYDSVRGATKDLRADVTNAENTNTTGLSTFNTDGFTVGGMYNTNKNAETYVAWNWKANGSGSSNTNGSITSTVSANVDAGFSIVSYTGTGSAATVGHGLSKAPDFFVTKTRNNTGDWMVYSGDATDFLKLNETNATEDLAAVWNDTSPTSSVFSLGSNGDVNTNGRTYIAYCFHSVDGYSKVGSYTGSGGTDGTFVYTGFRPAFVLIKRSNSAGQQAPIYDSARDTYNETVHSLKSDDSAAELTNQGSLDLLSNGFKARNNEGSTNTDGGIYIYIAFAETPFKYSNAR